MTRWYILARYHDVSSWREQRCDVYEYLIAVVLGADTV